jgi:tetratricopeptide (TPR) repeat protein
MAWTRAPKSPPAAGVSSGATSAERALAENKRALAQLHGGDRAAAIAAFAAALEADSSCVPAIVNVGNLLLEDGIFDDAVAHYEAALRIDAEYSAAHLNLGIAYKRLGRHAAAVRAFRRAHRIEGRLGARRR